MKKTTKKPAKYKKLNRTTDLMEKFARGMVNSIEFIVNDLADARRPRRKYARR